MIRAPLPRVVGRWRCVASFAEGRPQTGVSKAALSEAASPSVGAEASGVRAGLSKPLAFWGSLAVGGAFLSASLWNRRREKILRQLKEAAAQAAAAGVVPFYGKSWGQATDFFIEECLDTGDLVFLQGSLRTKRFSAAAALCVRRLLTGERVDSVGIVLVLSGRKFVLLPRERGLELVPYASLLASDSFSLVAIRRLRADAAARKAVALAAADTLRACQRPLPSELREAEGLPARGEREAVQANPPNTEDGGQNRGAGGAFAATAASFLSTTQKELRRKLFGRGQLLAIRRAVEDAWMDAGVRVLVERLLDIQRELATPGLLRAAAARRRTSGLPTGAGESDSSLPSTKPLSREAFFWRIEKLVADLQEAAEAEASSPRVETAPPCPPEGASAGASAVPALVVGLLQHAELLPPEPPAAQWTVSDLLSIERLLPRAAVSSAVEGGARETALLEIPSQNALGAFMVVRDEGLEKESLFFSGMAHAERKRAVQTKAPPA